MDNPQSASVLPQSQAPAQPASSVFNVRHLDAIEKYAIVARFGFLSYRMLVAYQQTGSTANLIYLFDQLLVVGFLLFRRPTEDISRNAGDWAVAMGGTFLPLLVEPTTTGISLLPAPVAMFFMLFGTMIHLYAKLILRRSFGVVAANRGVKTSGPYRFVRHPMYSGYVMTQAAFLLTGFNLYNAALIGACWMFLVLRIMAEERILMKSPAYQEMAATVKYRLIPGVY